MKSWIKSKTLWINVIAIASIIIRSELGYTLSPEQEGYILCGINILLRIITKEKLSWK